MQPIQQQPLRQRIRNYIDRMPLRILFWQYESSRASRKTEFYNICLALALKKIPFDFDEVKAIPGLEDGKIKTVTVAGTRLRLYISRTKPRREKMEDGTYRLLAREKYYHWTDECDPNDPEWTFDALRDRLYGWQQPSIQRFIDTDGRG